MNAVQASFAPLPVSGIPFILAALSTKGGVGKTTLVANTGAALADLGFRVLLIDADQQPALSKYYPLAHQAPYGLTQVIHSRMISQNEISNTNIPNLDIIISDDPEKKLQRWLADRLDRGTRLKIALKSPYVQQNYDFVIIDTQGAAGPLQEAAALAADMMISPVSPDILSAREFLEGTMELLDRIDVDEHMRPGPMRAVIYRQDMLKDSHEIAKFIRSQFHLLRGKVTIMDNVVPHAKCFKEAATRSMPVHRYEPQWIETEYRAEKQDGEIDPSAPTYQRIKSIGSGSCIMQRFLWELIPSLEGHRIPEGVEHSYRDVAEGVQQ